jgi:alginate O-acetyltransferase complex protein AlgI
MLPYEVSYYICLIFLLLLLFLFRSRFAQITILIGASYFLYILSNNYLILSVAFITILNFYCGNFIYYSTNKNFYLAIALVGSLGQLALFKYTGVLGALGFSFSALGVSYYTFMALSYVFDIYRGNMQPSDSLLEYALFCQWRSRNAQLWRNRSAQAYKYLPLFQLNLKPTLSAILGYQTLLSAFFEPVAIAFDIDGNAVV